MYKKKISFIWQGVTEMKPAKWRDGLWGATQILEKDFEVIYNEPWDDIDPEAVVLYWESPLTYQSRENGVHYQRVCNLPNKKILLFAGGPINYEWMDKFDHICVESAINLEECQRLNMSVSTAFGINSDIFKPMDLEKKWLTSTVGTCASWKRQWLAGESFGEQALVVGRGQDSDPSPFDRCREAGATVLEEHLPEDLVKLVNQSEICLQLADYWGGGQRTTLESMACGIPVVCMSDSPKNREYVEESGFGVVCEPDIHSIRNAVNSLKSASLSPKIGRGYIESKWTPECYFNNLKQAINEVLNNIPNL